MCDQCEDLQLTSKGYECFNAECPGNRPAHKPDPNESPSSPRTSGSPAAPDSLPEGTAVNSPPFSGSAWDFIRRSDGVPCPFCKVLLYSERGMNRHIARCHI